MSEEVDQLFASLEAGSAARRAVLSKDGTSRIDPYLTENSTAKEEFENYAKRPDALVNDIPAHHAILKESPRHRVILMMTLRGASPKEIAETLDISRQTVYNIRKQPWFRTLFVKMAKEFGRDAVEALLESEVLPSIETLREIRDEAPRASDRRAAADSLLDRFLGKPVAKTDANGRAPADIPTDERQLIEQTRALNRELQALGLNPDTVSNS